jgi:hypothetical protein
MNVKEVEVPAQFVPAAAVTRMGLVLFILTRRKGLFRRLVVFFIKYWMLRPGIVLILTYLINLEI